MAEPFLSEIRIMSFVLRPEGLGAVQRAAAAHQPEPGAVLAARHDLRRRRAGQLRAADLRGRTPIHVGSGHTLGERGGEQAHTLSIAELPTHTHVLQRLEPRTPTTPTVPTNNVLASDPQQSLRGGGQPGRHGSPPSVTNVGGSQAHLNMQPFLTLSFCIALQGIFPSPNLRRTGHGTTLCR